VSFRIVWFLKFVNFSEISGFFEPAKISQKFCENSSEISLDQKPGVSENQLFFNVKKMAKSFSFCQTIAKRPDDFE
jgi:hypothetical protein